MSNSNGKPCLSRRILNMTFMKRSKERVEREAEDEQSRLLYSKEISEKMKNASSNFIVVPSYSMCEGLIDGRLSFGGMNPEIELLMEQELAEKQQANSKSEQPKEESYRDMAYISKKFNSKQFNSKLVFKRKRQDDHQASNSGLQAEKTHKFKKFRDDAKTKRKKFKKFSFGGMNPEIELLMEQELAEKQRAHSNPEQPKEASYRDMAEANISKNFNSNLDFKSSKTSKQQDDDQASNSGLQAQKTQQNKFKKFRDDEKRKRNTFKKFRDDEKKQQNTFKKFRDDEKTKEQELAEKQRAPSNPEQPKEASYRDTAEANISKKFNSNLDFKSPKTLKQQDDDQASNSGLQAQKTQQNKFKKFRDDEKTPQNTFKKFRDDEKKQQNTFKKFRDDEKTKQNTFKKFRDDEKTPQNTFKKIRDDAKTQEQELAEKQRAHSKSEQPKEASYRDTAEANISKKFNSNLDFKSSKTSKQQDDDQASNSGLQAQKTQQNKFKKFRDDEKTPQNTFKKFRDDEKTPQNTFKKFRDNEKTKQKTFKKFRDDEKTQEKTKFKKFRDDNSHKQLN